MSTLVRRLCWSYLLLALVSIAITVLIGFTTEYGVRAPAGCNLNDALVIGVECRGFAGSSIATLFLNWPLFLIYGPLFAFSSAVIAIAALLLWAPPIYLIVDRLLRLHAT